MEEVAAASRLSWWWWSWLWFFLAKDRHLSWGEGGYGVVRKFEWELSLRDMSWLKYNNGYTSSDS